MSSKKDIKPNKQWLIYGIIILLSFGFLFLSGYPSLQSIRDSLWYDIGIFIALFIGILVVMFLKKLKTSVPTKIVLGVLFLLPAIRLLDMSVREGSNILYFYSVILVITVILVGIYRQNHSNMHLPFEKYPFIVGLFLMVISVSTVTEVDYVDKSQDPWLWVLILSLGITAISIILVIRFKEDIRDRQNYYFIPIGALMTSFCFIYLSWSFFNYSFDQSIPTEYSAEIIDKYIDTGRSEMTSYDLTILIDGTEFKVSTSQSRYYELEMGDVIVIQRYRGAFGYEYMIYEP